MTDANLRARKGDYVRVSFEGRVTTDVPMSWDCLTVTTDKGNIYAEFPNPDGVELEHIEEEVTPGYLYEDAEGDICFAREEYGKMHLYYTKELDTILLEDLGENCLPLRQIYPPLDV